MAVVFFDFDSTVSTLETLDETIARALSEHPDGERLTHEVEEITKQGMEGTIPFIESLEKRLAIIPFTKGLVDEVGAEIRDHVTEGIPEVFSWLRQNGHTPMIISGGFFESIFPTALMLGLSESQVFTNTFDYSEGFAKLNVEKCPMVTHGKSLVMNKLRSEYPNQKFIIVGDGMNDYRARESGAADLFIGFGANVVREPAKAVADHFVYSSHELLSLLQKIV